MSILNGKGYFIWQIRSAEDGAPDAIVRRAQDAGLTHVLIKIADDKYAFGYDTLSGEDQVSPVVVALKAAEIQVWGWHYVRGNDPVGEASIATERTTRLGLDGYVIDAEVEYKQPGKAAAARTYMAELRAGLPDIPIALSSYRYPAYHREFPWAAFLEKCDLNMPQVYWEHAHNPAQQLRRSLREFADPGLVTHIRPVVPTGSAYGSGGWRATPADLIEFLHEARRLDLPAANLYSWDWATSKGNTDLWDASAGFDWPTSPRNRTAIPSDDFAATGGLTPMPLGDLEPLIDQLRAALDAGDFAATGGLTPMPLGDLEPLIDQLRAALDQRDPAALASLYTDTAVHVTHWRTVVGRQAIRQWYTELFDQHLPNPAFNLYHVQRLEHVVKIRWNANSASGPFEDGYDLLQIKDGKIQFHTTNLRR